MSCIVIVHVFQKLGYTLYETEKSLRMHVRTHAVIPQPNTRKRKAVSPNTLAGK